MKSKNTTLQNTILETAKKYDLNTIAEKANSINEKTIKTKVAFLGEFSSGKTSLVNALIKKSFLPMFDKPTTAIITEIEKRQHD